MQIEATQHKRVTVTIDPEQTIYEMLHTWKRKIGVPRDAHISDGSWVSYDDDYRGSGVQRDVHRGVRGNEEEIYNAFRLVALNV